MTIRAVVDASVIVTWLLPQAARERNTLPALAVLDAITCGALEPLQPPHWLAEVATVTVCVTADEICYRKARALGGLVLLGDFQVH